MTTPTPEMKWSASPSYDFTGTFVAYVKEGDNTVLQTRCSSYEEADRIARTVVEAVNARLSPAETAKAMHVLNVAACSCNLDFVQAKIREALARLTPTQPQGES